MSDSLQIAQRLELHYYFRDDSHSMDATVRHECERELLILYKHIISDMGCNFRIETEAFDEGGLKEIWKFIGKHAVELTLAVAIIQTALTRFPVENKELTQAQIENTTIDTKLKEAQINNVIIDTKLKEVQIENTNADTELKREQIKDHKRIPKDLDLNNSDKSEKNQNQYDTTEANYKVRWHVSNFYRRISGYQKITKVSTKVFTVDSAAFAKELVVKRKDFYRFIQISDNLPPITDEEAFIDIISPVLRSGNFNWRGIYNGEPISFEMKDEIYKASVLNKQVEFLNGTAIRCVLKLSRRIDESGSIVVSKRQVLIVFETIINSKVTQTLQGKNYLKDKKEQSNQIALDF